MARDGKGNERSDRGQEIMGQAYWIPQDGPQAKAAICPVDFTFFGGSRGGGKSDCLLGRQIRGAEKHGPHWNGLIARRKYKEFAELRRRIDGLIAKGLPAERIGGDQQTNYVRFKNGAQFIMPAIQNLKMIDDHVGQQYTEISVDECTTFPFFSQMIDKLKGSLRSPHGVPCRMFGTGNPGGPGHNSVKGYFKLGAMFGVKPETVIYGENGDSRVFIPSFLDDNKILCDNDPQYVGRLKSIKDPALKKAWLDGNWDVYIGQAFLLTDAHIIDPIPIPKHAFIYMTFDWGYGKPFSVGWWWVDGDGRIYRFMEWYGCKGAPDEGLRITDNEIAQEIIKREQDFGIWNYPNIIRLAGPDCWNKKPDYKGGGQGPSTADVFASHKIYLTKGDASRSLKIRQFRERLLIKTDDEGKQTDRPLMQIYRTCKDFLRTIPALSMDDDNVEDIDTDQEDHIYDEACHICMARPIELRIPPSIITAAQSHIKMVETPIQDGYEREAVAEKVMDEKFWEYTANKEYYDGRSYSDVDRY